jgi:hypothetical protein
MKVRLGPREIAPKLFLSLVDRPHGVTSPVSLVTPKRFLELREYPAGRIAPLLSCRRTKHRFHFIPVDPSGGLIIGPTCQTPPPITDYSVPSARPVQLPLPAPFAFETEKVIHG